MNHKEKLNNLQNNYNEQLVDKIEELHADIYRTNYYGKGLTKEEFINWIDNKVLIEEDGTQMDDARYVLGYELLTTQKKNRDTADIIIEAIKSEGMTLWEHLKDELEDWETEHYENERKRWWEKTKNG